MIAGRISFVPPERVPVARSKVDPGGAHGRLRTPARWSRRGPDRAVTARKRGIIRQAPYKDTSLRATGTRSTIVPDIRAGRGRHLSIYDSPPPV